MTTGTQSHIPDVTELVEAARALVPVIKERAEKTDSLRRMPDETIAELKAAGFNKMYMPKRFGGFELDWGAHYHVARELGRACGSTAWTVSLVFSHIIWIGRFYPEAQDEFFARQSDPIVATGAAGNGVLTEVEGGYRLSGRWKFLSGVDHADCAIVTGRDDPDKTFSHFVMVYPEDYKIIDTWNTEGLRGTGSNDVEIGDCFVPWYRALRREDFLGYVTPGSKVNDHYMYRMRAAPMQRTWFAAPLVGTARGALEEYCNITKSRTGQMFGERIIDQLPVQIHVAESLAEIETAELIIDKTLQFIHESGLKGDDFDGIKVLKARRDMTFVARLCVTATTRLAEMMGASGQQRGNPVQRLMRDCRAVATHIELQWDHSMAPIGKYLFDLPTGDPVVDSQKGNMSGGSVGSLIGAHK